MADICYDLWWFTGGTLEEFAFLFYYWVHRPLQRLLDAPALLILRCLRSASPLAEATLALILVTLGASIASRAGNPSPLPSPSIDTLARALPLGVWSFGLITTGALHLVALLAWSRFWRSVGALLGLAFWVALNYAFVFHISFFGLAFIGPLAICATLVYFNLRHADTDQ